MSDVEVNPVLDPTLTQKPIWLKKFENWSALQKTCPARRGPTGIYCAWEGRNCGYTSCPRRIFEEEIVDVDAVPVAPKPPQKLKDRIKVLEDKSIATDTTISRLEVLMKEIKEKMG